MKIDTLKNSANLAFVVLVLVVLGCSCPKTDEAQKPSNAAPVSSKTPEKTEKTPEKKTEKTPEKETDDDSALTKKSPTNDSDDSLSMEKYNRIKNEMSYLDVVEIIGSDGKIIKVTPEGMTRYMWGDDNRFIMISFMNDRLQFKSQNGLD